MKIPPFVLASASPARRRLLQTVGIEAIVQASDFDESQIELSEPAELVKTLAQYKAETVAPQFQSGLIMGSVYQW
jgi:septum formation protein